MIATVALASPDWVSTALEPGWHLMYHARLAENRAPKPAMASRKQQDQHTTELHTNESHVKYTCAAVLLLY